MDALRVRLVHHIERQYRRNVVFEKLERQEQIAFEIRRIEHIDDDVGRTARKELDDDLLFGTSRIETVCTGKVYDLQLTTAVLKRADLLVDRNTRPVADLLTRACQTIEYCCFTYIRIARKSDR